MPKINIREQDPRKYEAVKAEQDKLKAIYAAPKSKSQKYVLTVGTPFLISAREPTHIRRKNVLTAERR